MEKQHIFNLLPSEACDVISRAGVETYRTKQVLDWIYGKQIFSFDGMTNLGEKTKSALKEILAVESMSIKEKYDSARGDIAKYLFELHDNNFIESVLIKSNYKNTVCVSTQVGCPLICAFCASCKTGFKRNLTAGEIVEQVMQIKKDCGKQINNVVYMGSGEPFLNYDNAIKSIRILNSKDTVNIGARKITVSTSGIIKGIEKLAKENIQVELSVSLHFVSDEKRGLYMSVNKTNPVKQLIKAIDEYTKKTNRVVTFEYVLIREINDYDKDAYEMTELLKDMKIKVNLIPFNKITDSDFSSPPYSKQDRFLNIIRKGGLNATLRMSRGNDINGACGQLRAGFDK